MAHLAAQDLGDLIDLERYQLDDPIHLAAVKARLDREGVVILPDFLRASARDSLVLEAEKQAKNAFFTIFICLVVFFEIVGGKGPLRLCRSTVVDQRTLRPRRAGIGLAF